MLGAVRCYVRAISAPDICTKANGAPHGIFTVAKCFLSQELAYTKTLCDFRRKVNESLAEINMNGGEMNQDL